MTSLPSRERGLKSQNKDTISKWYYVAPFAGAWIEIAHTARLIFVKKVAPFAGAWIEIIQMVKHQLDMVCRSLRGSVD